MAWVKVDMRLDGKEQGQTWLHLEPGAEVAGTVEVTPDEDVNCNRVYVCAAWHTEGDGNEDKGVGAEVELFRGELKAGVTSAYDFRLTLPREPWSYDGTRFSILWELKAGVDLPWAADPIQAQPFVLRPRRGAGEPRSQGVRDG